MATGRADAMVDPLVNPWDVAPVAVIIPEAGGRTRRSTARSGIDSWRAGSGVASNGSIHKELIDLWTS
ncbi:MAG: hypothetical protein R2695_16955 [Acidimicrobiales bacterium]